MRPEIVLVVAAAANRAIGLDGKMPWHISEDLKRFRRITVGKPVIMGRKTFDSIGKPLPGRHNIVLTRDTGWTHEGVTVAQKLAEAIAAAGLDPRARAEAIMIIGGAQIYAQALPIATTIELTRVHASPAADAYFPEIDASAWQEVSREDHPAVGETPAYSFIRLERLPSALVDPEVTG